MLCQGRVKLSTCSKEGKVIILRIAEEGEIIGLSPAISGTPHIATAEALVPCRINFIRKKDFLRFLEQNVEACFSALMQLSQNYNTASLQIGALGLFSSVADKLAALFLGWCRQSNQNGDGGFHLDFPYTHEDIAQMIGTSRETVTRTLKSFRDRKLIIRNGSKLIIPDKAKLEAIIGSRKRTKK
jgi:CRP/FNR family transcriptional regulator